MVYHQLIEKIVLYTASKQSYDLSTYQKAINAFLDNISCSLFSLKSAQCDYTLGPIIPGTDVPLGSCLPASDLIQDPVKAAFDNAFLVNFLNFSAIYPNAKSSDLSPADSGAALYALAEYLAKKRNVRAQEPLFLKEFLDCFIKAYEIYGVLSKVFDLSSLGLDDSYCAKISTVASSMALLRKDESQLRNVLTHAFADGFDLFIAPHQSGLSYRNAWVGASAVSRAITLVYMVVCGEPFLSHSAFEDHWLLKKTTSLLSESQISSIEFESEIINNLSFKYDIPGQRICRQAAFLGARVKKEFAENIENCDRLVCFLPKQLFSRFQNEKIPLGLHQKLSSFKYSLLLGLTEESLTEKSFLKDESRKVDSLWSKILLKEHDAGQEEITMYASRNEKEVVQHFILTQEKGSLKQTLDKFEKSASTLLSQRSIKECLNIFSNPEKALQTSFFSLGALLAEKESF
jgi:2-methylcitrate dehydratase PrpD